MSKSTILILSAVKSDSDQLIGWFRHYGSRTLIKKRIDCYLKHNSTIVAKSGNKIVGVLQWYAKEEPDDGVAEIEEVFVSKECRRQGIGSMLVEYAIDSVKAYYTKSGFKPRAIYLFVGKDNIAARRLYEKHGFKLVNSVGKLFSDDEEELFYSRKFSA